MKKGRITFDCVSFIKIGYVSQLINQEQLQCCVNFQHCLDFGNIISFPYSNFMRQHWIKQIIRIQQHNDT